VLKPSQQLSVCISSNSSLLCAEKLGGVGTSSCFIFSYLASAGAVFVTGMSTMAGFQASLERDKQLRRWDVDVRLADSDQVSTVALTDLVAQIPNVTHVEAWSVIQTSLLAPSQKISVTRTYPDQGYGSISVTVVPPKSTLVNQP
jgi:putative ABC transport system permease protein